VSGCSSRFSNLHPAAPNPLHVNRKKTFYKIFTRYSGITLQKNGDALQIIVRDVSLGGCLMDWDENIFPGQEFRIELELPNKNRLPLLCKILYKSANRGIGAKFIDVSQFEQELLGQIISQNLEDDGVSLAVDPFAMPPTYVAQNDEEFLDERYSTEEMPDEIMSTDN
jgi:hypothetical protein